MKKWKPGLFQFLHPGCAREIKRLNDHAQLYLGEIHSYSTALSQATQKCDVLQKEKELLQKWIGHQDHSPLNAEAMIFELEKKLEECGKSCELEKEERAAELQSLQKDAIERNLEAEMALTVVSDELRDAYVSAEIYEGRIQNLKQAWKDECGDHREWYNEQLAYAKGKKKRPRGRPSREPNADPHKN